MNVFLHHLTKYTGLSQLHSRTLETLQVNLGARCTLECRHCHLAASPRRTEAMSETVMDQILTWLAGSNCQNVDLTGGAPELHPLFHRFVTQLRNLSVNVQVRTNLTIYLEPDMAETAAFLRENQVTL
ncbi:MAG: 4Fe-4S cluster-binding domain-containing protein, partial [Magnetococcales bacterium]|nr:4Fe-4S cluster-binding domain-containing protein [Magnetococcales bacterium]